LARSIAWNSPKIVGLLDWKVVNVDIAFFRDHHRLAMMKQFEGLVNTCNLMNRIIALFLELLDLCSWQNTLNNQSLNPISTTLILITYWLSKNLAFKKKMHKRKISKKIGMSKSLFKATNYKVIFNRFNYNNLTNGTWSKYFQCKPCII